RPPAGRQLHRGRVVADELASAERRDLRLRADRLERQARLRVEVVDGELVAAGLEDGQGLALQLQRRVALRVDQARQGRLDRRLDAGADDVLRANARAGRRAVGGVRHDWRAGVGDLQ